MTALTAGPVCAGFALALGLGLALQSGEVYEVEPCVRPWERVGEVFDLALRLPEERRAPGRDLAREMEELVTRRFDVSTGAEARERTLGDLALEARAKPHDERAEWLKSLERHSPDLADGIGLALRELLQDERLFSEGWNPDRDSSRDGILHAPGWELEAEGESWKRLPGSPRVEQAAVLVWADTATLKAVENDYASYHDDVGAPYEKLRPVPGSYYTGQDPAGKPFATLRIEIRRDLPFPFSDYEMDLRSLNRVDARGRLVTDVQSKSPDFHWLCGRDVFWPVADGAGRPVAILMVRLYGFDLDGVPDSPEHRRKALRESLGNLKRKAEALARERGTPMAQDDAQTVPAFRVLGAR